jgi:hypothetical protein
MNDCNTVDLAAVQSTRVELARKHGRIAYLSDRDWASPAISSRCPGSSALTLLHDSVRCACGQHITIVDRRIPEHDFPVAA